MNRIITAKQEKHEFALYVESFSFLLRDVGSAGTFIITDEKLIHRIVMVLRLEVNDKCIVFDRLYYAHCMIVAVISKKQICMVLESKYATTILNPTITFLLPVLKKDDYESALYSLAEIGVNVIQLVLTKKSQGLWSDKHDRDRSQRILIAAAEQSKNYCFPLLKAPIILDKALDSIDSQATKIFFDSTGAHCFSVMQMLYSRQPHDVVLLVGPEGDLSSTEKEMVKEKDFIVCALTPTVVRATQAASLSAGLIRSILAQSFV